MEAEVKSIKMTLCAIAFLMAGVIAFTLIGCAGGPSYQGQTTVLGMEVETMGSVASAESPMPKLRVGLIHHQMQVIQQTQAAMMYSDKENVNLWTASGTTRDTYQIAPAPVAKSDNP